MAHLMTELIIRPAQDTDIAAMSALWYEQLLIRAQQDRRWEAQTDIKTVWQGQVADWLRDERCVVLVGLAGVQMAGFIVGWVQPAPPGIGSAWMGIITELVLDAHRYQGGAARALVTALRARFEGREDIQWMAYAPHRDVVAQAFWRSYGAVDWMDRLWITS
jgi:hypothetical protein